MDKEFYLIRHGQSMGNIGMDSGNDPDLSPLGHAQAKQCGIFMQDHCDENTLLISSPFERCLRTAEAIAERNGLKIKMEPSLHEFFSSDWFVMSKVQLLSLPEKAARHPLVSGFYPPEQWWPIENETSEDLDIRMAMFRNRLLSNEFDAEKVICIGHWASIASLANSMVPGIEMPVVENAAITCIYYNDGEFSVEFINATL